MYERIWSLTQVRARGRLALSLVLVVAVAMFVVSAPVAEAVVADLAAEQPLPAQEGGKGNGDDKEDRGAGQGGGNSGDNQGGGNAKKDDPGGGNVKKDGVGGGAAGAGKGPDKGGGGKKGDRGRPVDRDRSLLDDVIARLLGDDVELADVVATGTIGDVYRELRGRGQVARIARAIREEVKGAAVVDRTVDLSDEDALTDETDKKTGRQRKVVRVESAAGDVTATVPVEALQRGVSAIALTIAPITDLDVLTASIPLPASSRDLSETVQTPFVAALDIEISDQDGTPITQFDEELTFSIQVDPAAVDLGTVKVVFFDDELGVWVPVVSSANASGVVEWSTDHLTLFALLRFTRITHVLVGGLNPITFTGPSGTTPEAIATAIGAPLENLLTFDGETQTFRSFIPGAPAIFNTLSQLTQREALFLRVAEGETVEWTGSDIVVNDSGERSVDLLPGLNVIGFTGDDASLMADLLSPVAEGVISAAHFDTALQQWLTFVPGAPAFANTLLTLDRLDVLFVRYAGAAVVWTLPESAAP